MENWKDKVFSFALNYMLVVQSKPMLSNKVLVNKLYCIQVATIRHFSRKYLSIDNGSIVNDDKG